MPLDLVYNGVRSTQHASTSTCPAAGSVDRTVRVWELASGMPLGVSPRHGGSVRCLHLDKRSLISGCTDELVRVWDASPAAVDGSGGRRDGSQGIEARSQGMRAGEDGGRHNQIGLLHFDLSQPRKLSGHTGPVTCLELNDRCRFPNRYRTSMHCAFSGQ